jgi:hypothetical protein
VGRTGQVAVGVSTEPSRLDRRLAVVFVAVAVVLAPWIVVLYLTQVSVGSSGDLVLTSAGVLTVLGVALATGAVACGVGSRYAVIPVTFGGVLAAVTAFFHLVTGTATSPTAAVVSSVLVFAPVVVLCGWVVLRRDPARLPRWAPIAFGVAAVAMVPVLLRAVATAGPAILPASHLRLTWTALDVVELVAVLATAVALARGSAAVAIAATSTAALLLSDVWFNVVATTGATRTSGLQMSAVSLPLAALSLGVAVRAVRRRPTSPPHPS